MEEPALATLPLPGHSLSPASLLRRPAPLRLPAPPPARPGSLTGHDLALEGIVHDARNLVTALRLCAELMEEPGILAAGQQHFAGQVHALAEASDYILRRLTSVTRTASLASQASDAEVPVVDLADAVRHLAGLLSAVVGPAIAVRITALPCAGRLSLSEESLTRILLNLARNSADAMTSGSIRIRTQPASRGRLPWLACRCSQPLCEQAASPAPGVRLIVEDDGPGIPGDLLERIFDPGFTTRRGAAQQHHGLGLSIVRQLVERAGGSVRALAAPGRGARFEIELPLTDVTPPLLPECLTTDRSLSK